jgi:hypothetical protein
MRYRAIQEHDRRYPIRLMCRALAVSPAGYYAWRGRPESQRSAANRALLTDIRVIHQESRQTYGSPSIWHALVRRAASRPASRGPADAPGWHPSQDDHEVVRYHPLAASIPRGREHPGADVHRRGTKSSVGRRYYLHLDPEGLALPGRPAGSLLTPGGGLGDGPAIDRRSGRAGPDDGAGEPSPWGGAPAPLGPRQSVCGHELPAPPPYLRAPPQHEPQGELLGQCLCRKLFRDTQARARLPSALRNPGRSDPGHLRISRSVL